MDFFEGIKIGGNNFIKIHQTVAMAGQQRTSKTAVLSL